MYEPDFFPTKRERENFLRTKRERERTSFQQREKETERKDGPRMRTVIAMARMQLN